MGLAHYTKDFVSFITLRTSHMEFIFIDVQLYFHSKLNYFCYMHKPNLSILNSIIIVPR